ncbi:unnamed protein product [Arctia plantaginis]|uniref:STX17-like N-terminal domain-containing protein n=1 Tax=Arctia plantaginis TaxID=874455 RepID=A0A8S1AI13_ARCPL|nr:unnamed protein product [Arctia plantaginis]CAB3247331.1 unnamed protein product [Arctia plantaginis]
MDEDNKLPLKRVELSLTKFNEVAIPHHLGLLRQHKTNILKYEECGELARARVEQRHAGRVAAQLRALLLEMDALRGQVRDPDRARFDALTQRSRDTTLKAIVDYLGVIESSCKALVQSSAPRARRTGTSPLAINRRVEPSLAVAASDASTDSVGVVAHAQNEAVPLEDKEQIQLRVDDQELALSEREALLRGWSELQSEVRALHEVWQHAQAAALAQRDHVEQAAAHVDIAAENVSAARHHLASAERLRAGAYVGGACVGAMVGGPLGLCVGAKAGALAAAAGSLLGYVGVRLLRRDPPPSSQEDKDKDQ